VKIQTEKSIKVGFRRSAKKIVDEIESTTAAMIRSGWSPLDSVFEEGLGKIHLFFEKDVSQSRQEESSNAI